MIIGLSQIATPYINAYLNGRLKSCLPNVVSWNQSAFVEVRRFVDNVLLAQEIVNDYSKNKGKPRCTLNVDIMKAFDTVNLKFVHTILQAIGFPPLFVNWIRACLTIPIFSFNINGCLKVFF